VPHPLQEDIANRLAAPLVALFTDAVPSQPPTAVAVTGVKVKDYRTNTITVTVDGDVGTGLMFAGTAQCRFCWW
jgi:hypothetical protein